MWILYKLNLTSIYVISFQLQFLLGEDEVGLWQSIFKDCQKEFVPPPSRQNIWSVSVRLCRKMSPLCKFSADFSAEQIELPADKFAWFIYLKLPKVLRRNIWSASVSLCFCKQVFSADVPAQQIADIFLIGYLTIQKVFEKQGKLLIL